MREHLKSGALRLLSGLEAVVDRSRVAVRRRGGPFHIIPYRGHGTSDTLLLRGRVLAGDPIPPASRHDSAMRNLVNTLRRLESDEVPGARVRAALGGRSWEAVADDEGFFELRMDHAVTPEPGKAWHEVPLELLDPPSSQPVRTSGWVLVPPPEALFGTISDIDDTVVKTDATNVLRMLRLVFLTNAHTRLAFEGVAAFYRALQHGAAGEHSNPIFFVSSSPWNLYDLLHEVFDVHRIPAGPFFLKVYGLANRTLLSSGHGKHKLEAIEEILATHPALPFVLLGDSGQQDPEIYREVVRRYPGRVEAIYIRDVVAGRRDAEVHAIAAEVRADGVEMVLVKDTVQAAVHAADRGLIDASALPLIRGEKAADEAAPSPLSPVS